MSDSQLSFRTATLDDADALQQLIQTAFRAEDSREGWVGLADLAAGFTMDAQEVRDRIAQPDSVIIVAADAGSAYVGCAGVSRRGDDMARVTWVAVDPARHRAGVGRKVLERAEAYSREAWGVAGMGLNALSSRGPLIDWYMRRGYERTGEESPFPLTKVNGRPLPEGLCFVEMEKRF